MVEPDNDLVVLSEARDSIVTRPKVCASLFEAAEAVRNEGGACLAPCVRVEAGGNWPFVREVSVD